MELSFHGATGTTTGSCHMVRTGGHTLLLDCGMFQGRRDECRARNERFGFDPAAIDAVVQSHAHIDHSGKLPMLARHGFRGRVFATPATRDLCEVMLHDSARILMQDGHTVVAAASADEALTQMEQQRFDVVLSDHGLGLGMNGLELATAIRDRWPGTRFILVTGWGGTIDPEEVRPMGVEAVIGKPYRAPELRERINAAP